MEQCLNFHPLVPMAVNPFLCCFLLVFFLFSILLTVIIRMVGIFDVMYWASSLLTGCCTATVQTDLFKIFFYIVADSL